MGSQLTGQGRSRRRNDRTEAATTTTSTTARYADPAPSEMVWVHGSVPPMTITSQAGSITVDLKLWEGVRPGTVAKCYGQGHWAYGRVATKDYAKSVPLGGNNNTILVDDLDRLSGSTARNGGFTGVRITKA